MAVSCDSAAAAEGAADRPTPGDTTFLLTI